MEKVGLSGDDFYEFAEKLVLVGLDLTQGVHFLLEAHLVGLVDVLEKFLDLAVAHLLDCLASAKLGKLILDLLPHSIHLLELLAGVRFAAALPEVFSKLFLGRQNLEDGSVPAVLLVSEHHSAVLVMVLRELLGGQFTLKQFYDALVHFKEAVIAICCWRLLEIEDSTLFLQFFSARSSHHRLQQRACLCEEVLVSLVAECDISINSGARQCKSGGRGCCKSWCLLSLPRTWE